MSSNEKKGKNGSRKNIVVVFFALAVILIIFLSGCVNRYYSETISPNGQDKVVIKIDFSQIAGMMQSMSGNSSYNFSKNMSDSCNDFKNNQSIAMSNKECNYDSKTNVATLSGYVQLSKSVFSSENKNGKIEYVYHLNHLKQLNELLFSSGSSSSLPNATSLDKMNAQELKMTETMFPINFTVKMPGKIISSDVGKVANNSVVGDFYDLLGNKGDPKIVSVEKNRQFGLDWSNPIVLGSLLGVFGIVILIVFLFARKGSKKMKQ